MRTLLVLEETLAILRTVGADAALVGRFETQARFAVQHKARGRAPDSPEDAVTVSSGLGKGPHVELTIGDALTQMPAPKAIEIGLMLIQAAEAAINDECVRQLLKHIGAADDPEMVGRILLELREIRQGTRGTSRPT